MQDGPSKFGGGARLILSLADELTRAGSRAKLDCSDGYIDGRRKRFAADRLAGLFGRRAGRERLKLTDRTEARVLAHKTKQKPSDGSTVRSTRKLAAGLGGVIPRTTVARVRAAHGTEPHRLQGELASNDQAPETKADDVIALCLDPPQHATVFSIDETTAIEPLDRTA